MLISCMDIRRDSPNACPWFCGSIGTGTDPFRCFIHPYLWNANWFEGADLEYVYEYQTHATQPTAAIAPQPGRQSATRRTIMAPSSWNNGCLPSTLITVYAGFLTRGLQITEERPVPLYRIRSQMHLTHQLTAPVWLSVSHPSQPHQTMVSRPDPSHRPL